MNKDNTNHNEKIIENAYSHSRPPLMGDVFLSHPLIGHFSCRASTTFFNSASMSIFLSLFEDEKIYSTKERKHDAYF